MNESPRVPAGERDHADVVVMPPALYAGALVLGLVLGWVLGGGIPVPRVLALSLGSLLVTAGAVLGVGFSRAFRAIDQDRSPRTPTPSIITDGLYRFSRNPAYVSLSMILLGLGLLLDNPWIIGLLPPVLLVMHYGVVLREEAYLERTFGEEYLDYKRRVRRWL